MKIIYFDCFAGIAGDMILGALIDLGVDIHQLEKELAKLSLPGYHLNTKRVKKQAVQATQFQVLLKDVDDELLADAEFHEVDLGSRMHDTESGIVDDQGLDAPNSLPTTDRQLEHDTVRKSAGRQHSRSLAKILDLIEASNLSPETRSLSQAIFTRLGEAEARVHNQPLDHVHLHEVGAVDAIIDIVGAVIGLELLGVDEVYASPLHLGSGFVNTAHGLLPVPAPATAELCTGIPVYTTQAKGELVTPTGAAFISTVTRSFGSMPMMKVKAIGYGAGSREREFPNVLRAFLGESTVKKEDDLSAASLNRLPHPEQHNTPESPGGYHISPAVVIEANLDDMLPQFYENLTERLLEADALDVVMTQIQMKKNRPGIQLQVLASPGSIDSLLTIIFNESTTIGVRTYEVQKRMLQRETVSVQTPFGTLRVKIARQGDKVVNIAPEYEDCRARARESGMPVKEIYNAAIFAFYQELPGE
jgi:pyridinium-3,5-bisthiocarboxylic acid mononucleotide nickel chelatase